MPIRLSSSTVSLVSVPSPAVRVAGSQDETQCRIVAGAPAHVPGIQVRLLGARLMHGNFERVGGGREHADVNALESGRRRRAARSGSPRERCPQAGPL